MKSIINSAYTILLVLALAGSVLGELTHKTQTFVHVLPKMKPGEVLLQNKEGKMDMPLGHVGISYFHQEIVMASNASFVPRGNNYDGNNYDEAGFVRVPTSQLYNHHWTAQDVKLPPYSDVEAYAKMVEDGNKSFANGPCDSLKLVFGGGAETSDSPLIFPDPYYYILDGDEYFQVNLHLIDLRGVPEEEVQPCLQCNCQYHYGNMYGDNIPPYLPLDGGGVQCCFGGMKCNSELPDNDTVQYYIRYNITYADYDPEEMKPLYMSTLSASSKTASICEVEFNPPVCTADNGPQDYTTGLCVYDNSTALIEFDWKVGSEIDLLASRGHAHIGTVDGVLASSIEKVEGNDGDVYYLERDLCHSAPSYGKPGSIDESFLVHMSECNHMDNQGQPQRLKKDSVVRVSGQYNAVPSGFVPIGQDSENVKFKAPYDGSMVYWTVSYAFPTKEHSYFGDVLSN